MPSLLKYIDPENLPRYLGGTSDATLIDDAGPWNDPQIRAEIEEDMAHRDGSGSQAMSGLPAPSLAASPSRPISQGAAQPLLGNAAASSTRGPEAASLSAMPPAYGVSAASTPERSSPFAAQAHNPHFDAENAQVWVVLAT